MNGRHDAPRPSPPEGRPWLRRGLLALLFVAVSAWLSACVPGCVAYGPYEGKGEIIAKGVPTTASPSQELRIDLSGSHVSMLDDRGLGIGTNAIEHGVFRPGTEDNPDKALGGGTLVVDDCRCFQGNARPVEKAIVTVRMPSEPGAYRLVITLRSWPEDPSLGTAYWFYTKAFDIAVVAPGSAAPVAAAQNPVARFFPDQAPADKDTPALVDGRLSTDPRGQPLAYAWDLDGDGVFGDPTDGGTGTTPPAGTAYVSTAAMNATWARSTQYQPVGLKVTTPDGRSATSVGTMRITTGLGAGSFFYAPAPHVFAPGAAFVPELVLAPGIAAAIDPAYPVTVCMDLNGDGVHGDGGPLVLTARPDPVDSPILHGSAVADPAVGYHRITATLWASGYNTDCANTGGDTFDNRETAPYIQFVSAVYETSAAAGRKQKARTYRAKATLRTRGATPVALGTLNARGNVEGMVVRGTYAFRTPAKAKGAARPPALGLFTGGPYVMRVREASLGLLKQQGTFPIVGSSTMLMRGSGGALACLDVATGEVSSVYTLLGGTGPIARTSMVANAEPVLYPTGRADPPANFNPAKAKQGKATRGSGTVVAGSTKRARGLPAACRSLVGYLP